MYHPGIRLVKNYVSSNEICDDFQLIDRKINAEYWSIIYKLQSTAETETLLENDNKNFIIVISRYLTLDILKCW